MVEAGGNYGQLFMKFTCASAVKWLCDNFGWAQWFPTNPHDTERKSHFEVSSIEIIVPGGHIADPWTVNCVRQHANAHISPHRAIGRHNRPLGDMCRPRDNHGIRLKIPVNRVHTGIDVQGLWNDNGEFIEDIDEFDENVMDLDAWLRIGVEPHRFEDRHPRNPQIDVIADVPMPPVPVARS